MGEPHDPLCRALDDRPIRDGGTDGPASLAAAWECDLADGMLRWSPGVYDLFGLPRDTLLDRETIVGMYVEESRLTLERLRREAIETCGSFTFEARIRRADGALRWMRVSADVVCRDGVATHLYGLKQDITNERDEVPNVTRSDISDA